MWWQVIPPLAIVTGLVSGMFVGMPVVHYVFTGRPTMRALEENVHFEPQQWAGYRRDWNMCGNEFESRGLDNLPDE